MQFEKDISILKEFEMITQSYYEEGYAHVKDCFRQKEALIKNIAQLM